MQDHDGPWQKKRHAPNTGPLHRFFPVQPFSPLKMETNSIHLDYEMPDRPTQYPQQVVGVEKVPVLRTYSMPVAVESLSYPATPTRATFPFKPASTLITLQQSQTMDSETNSSHDACNFLPSHFRPRPVVPALPLQTRRCASFPTSYSEERQSPPPPGPPDWLVSATKEKAREHFPISISASKDSNCWWLKEIASIAKGRQNTIVHVGEDEIELVDSEEEPLEEIDVIEESRVDISNATEGQEQLKESKEDVDTEDRPCAKEESADIKGASDNNIATIDTSEAAASTLPSLNISNDLQQQQYSLEEMKILQEKMKDLRVEMEKAEDLDPEKKKEMDKFFQQVEGAIMTDGDDKANATPSAFDHIRRTTVAITGGTLTVAGVALIPCPIIPGCLVIYGGLLVLATEFDSAKKALDTVKEPLEQWLADDEEGDTNEVEEGNHNSEVWEELIGYTPENGHDCKKDIDDDFWTMIEAVMSNSDASPDNPKKLEKSSSTIQNKAVKQFLRKVLMLDSAETDATATKGKGTLTVDKSGSNAPSSSDKNAQTEPSCHSDLSGCKLFSFDFDEDDTNGDMTDAANKTTLNRQHKGFERLCSDGSITLNTLHECDDTTIRLLSRQSSSSGGNVDECLSWVRFGCHSFLDEDQLRCQLNTIEKKR